MEGSLVQPVCLCVGNEGPVSGGGDCPDWADHMHSARLPSPVSRPGFARSLMCKALRMVRSNCGLNTAPLANERQKCCSRIQRVGSMIREIRIPDGTCCDHCQIGGKKRKDWPCVRTSAPAAEQGSKAVPAISASNGAAPRIIAPPRTLEWPPRPRLSARQ